MLINKLLLERIPFDALNADLTLPDIEAYLADRMDEKIGRIELIKKIECITGISSSIRI